MAILCNTQAKELMNTDLTLAAPDWPLAKARVVLKEKRIGGLPVADKDGKLLGIITPDDINDAYLLARRAEVREFMTRELITAAPGESFGKCSGSSAPTTRAGSLW